MKSMLKVLIFVCQIFCLIFVSGAATVQSDTTQTSAYNYNYMYPFMNNQMRNELNPGTSPSLNSNPINTVVRTENFGTPRRVVPRRMPTTGVTPARSATGVRMATPAPSSARSAMPASTAQPRRVVARSATNGGGIVRRATPRSSRGDASYLGTASANAANAPESTTQPVPSARCLADYTECMNGYCQRENAAYNRCYCSAKLAQIDSKYQTEIEDLIHQIIRLQNTNYWTDAEMNDYWMSIVGKYSGENSWVNLDNALNIDWASMESRVRGQQAFATGHEYCVQHLRGCQYMAANMRDAYRSEISRDCAKYESGLQTIKNVAESLVESYK